MCAFFTADLFPYFWTPYSRWCKEFGCELIYSCINDVNKLILFERSLILIINHKIVNKNIKGMKSEKIKVKTLFCDKDLSSLDSIN